MKAEISFAALALTVFVGSCAPADPDACVGISAEEATVLARDAKADMAETSTQEWRSNFEGDQVTSVATGAQTNGYAAVVVFPGRDQADLVALIHDDCGVGWTTRD